MNKINKNVHTDNHGLYRNDGLSVVPNNRKANDKIKKIAFQIDPRPLFRHYSPDD